MNKRKDCQSCRRPASHCYCQILAKIRNDYPVWIFQHRDEIKHPLGTARMVYLSLENACLFEQGSDHFNEALGQLGPRSVLVYPGDDAQHIESYASENIERLVFIDANWRKSYRMLQETEQLRELPRVTFSSLSKARYRIRKAPKPGYLSTLESVVAILSCLEHDERKYQTLIESMDAMIDRQIASMGKSLYKKNYEQEKR